MATSMQVNAIMGANMPVAAPILCSLGNLESSETLVELTCFKSLHPLAQTASDSEANAVFPSRQF